MRLEILKLGLIFDPAKHKSAPMWMKGFAQAPNAVLIDDFVRVYFCTRGEADGDGMYTSRLAYVDLSAKNLEVLRISDTPCLELGGLGEFDEFGTYPVSVLKIDNELFAAYGGWTRCQTVPFNISIGMSKMDLGDNVFRKFGNGPVLAPHMNEPHTITSPKLRYFDGKYVMTYTAGEKWILDENGKPEIIYKLKIAFSDDLVNWTRLNRNILSTSLDADEAQACGDIVYNNGKYHMFFCYREALNFRTDPLRSYRIGYAISTDLENWERQDEVVNGLKPSTDKNAWDHDMVAYPNVVKVADRWIMFYGGNGNGKTGFGAMELKNF